MKPTRFLLIFCLSLLLVSLTACGPKETQTDDTTNQTNQTQSTTETPTADDSPNTPDASQSTEEVPEDPNAITFFDCGSLDLPNSGDTTGRENFEEFLNVTGVGKSATIQITQYTTEGDPIVSTLSYDGSVYTLKVDNSADAFAAADARGVTESTWKRLVITETTSNGTLYQAFRLTNLDEGAVTGDTPDGDDVYSLFQEPLED